jgi:hypothetical protein
MTKNFLAVALIFISISNVFSQKLTEDFNLTPPESKVNSVYSKLIVIDARLDTTNMGVIQKGAFNRKALLIPKTPLKKQIIETFNQLIKSDAGGGELILNLRDFKFAEVTEAFSETGYCYLRADLFAKKEDNSYQKIDAVDTVLEVGAMDVTKKNIRNGSEKLIQFLTSNMKVVKDGDVYSFEDIKNIEKLEKRKLPVYNTTNYKNGLYMTYDNFKWQNPSISNFAVTKNKKGKITGVQRFDKEGNKVEVDFNQLYCIVDEGKIYITSGTKGYPVEFKDDDFYFEGRAKVTAKTGNVVLATAFFGILGGLLASDASADFVMKIDHLNGAAIQVKEIEKK